MSKSANGEYASDTIVLSIPRQVGKTYLVACIIFALCLIHPKLKVIWTAHRKTTAAETFRQFDGMAQRPKVAPHIRQVYRGKGEEQVLFNNGSRIMFGARESGFGRGMTDVGVLVLDEGQILPVSTLEDMGATQNVAANPLTFVMGTPPRPRDDGEFFASLRQEAIDGDSDSTLYVEFSADRGADPMDRDQWRKANPSFPHRTSERALLRLRKKLKSDDSWNREALGIWDDKHRAVLTASEWSALDDDGPDVGVRPTALAVDMSHDHEISVAACWALEGDMHAEEVFADVDSIAAIDWIVEHAGRRIPVLVDSASPAMSLVPELKRCKVIQSNAADMAKACGLVYDLVKAGLLTHAAQNAVAAAVRGARRRPIRDAGGWGWDRRDEKTNIAPLVALTLAVLGAATHKKRSTPRREAVILG